jgi:hypothetical protein
MLQNWESSVVDEMNVAWVNPVDLSLPKLAARLDKQLVGKEDLAAALSRAAGPTDKEGKPLDRANPHWPNSGQSWSNEFVAPATDGIFAAIEAASETYSREMQESLRETLQSWASSLQQLTMRDAKAELLWLHTSKYSPSARKGYASLNPPELVMHAVVDISRTVTRLAPVSVEYFLRDLVAQLAPDSIKLTELIAAISPTLGTWPEARSIAAEEQLPANGRRTWLDYAVRANKAEAFETQLGVPGDFEDRPSELAVHLYRELQIRKLLASAS